MLPSLSAPRRLSLVTGLLAVAIMAGAVFSVFIPRGQKPHSNWNFPASVPALSLGSDLRLYIQASQTMFEGENPLHANYNLPPFAAAVFWAMIPLSEPTAYRIQFYLTIAESVLALFLCGWLLRRLMDNTGDEQAQITALSGACFLLTTFFLFFGYPLEFALERGNDDCLVLLLMCTGLWLLLQPNARPWLPILLLSLAAHLKVYPAVLLLIPLWRDRWRAVLPVAAINGVLLFWFGFDRAMEFFQGLYLFSRDPYLWMGNHSAASFSALVLAPGLKSLVGETLASRGSLLLTLLVPFALWLHGAVRLFRAGFNSGNALVGFALCVPLMCVLPSVSNDYKLVIAVIPVFLGLRWFSDRYVVNGRWTELAGLLGTLVCLLAIAQSIFYPPLFFTPNKYPFVLGLQWLMHRVVLERTSVSPKLRSVTPPTAGSLA